MAATHFRNALHFFPMSESGWMPKVLCYSGFYGYGVKEVWDMVGSFEKYPYYAPKKVVTVNEPIESLVDFAEKHGVSYYQLKEGFCEPDARLVHIEYKNSSTERDHLQTTEVN